MTNSTAPPNTQNFAIKFCFITSFVCYSFSLIFLLLTLTYIYVGSRYEKTFIQLEFILIILLLIFGSSGGLIYNVSIYKAVEIC